MYPTLRKRFSQPGCILKVLAMLPFGYRLIDALYYLERP